MKQERIEKIAKKLKIKLDDENRAILNLKISDDSNFLSPYYYDKPIISNDVASFINLNKAILLWKYGLTINIISDVIDKDEEETYKNAIKHFYETDLIHNKRTMKRNYMLALIMFIIGVLVFSLMFILDHFFANSLGLWKEVIDVVAWVFIWESVDIAFIEKIENSNLIKISNNIINSKIIFSKMINVLIQMM